MNVSYIFGISVKKLPNAVQIFFHFFTWTHLLLRWDFTWLHFTCIWTISFGQHKGTKRAIYFIVGNYVTWAHSALLGFKKGHQIRDLPCTDLWSWALDFYLDWYDFMYCIHVKKVFGTSIHTERYFVICEYRLNLYNGVCFNVWCRLFGTGVMYINVFSIPALLNGCMRILSLPLIELSSVLVTLSTDLSKLFCIILLWNGCILHVDMVLILWVNLLF